MHKRIVIGSFCINNGIIYRLVYKSCEYMNSRHPISVRVVCSDAHRTFISHMRIEPASKRKEMRPILFFYIQSITCDRKNDICNLFPWILQIPHYSGALQRTAGCWRKRRLRHVVVRFPSTLHRSNGPSHGRSELLQSVPVALRRRSSAGACAARCRLYENFRPSPQPARPRDIDVFRFYATPRRHSDLSRDPEAREHAVHLDPSATARRR